MLDLIDSKAALRLEVLDRAIQAKHWDHRPLVEIAKDLQEFVEGEGDD